MRYIVPLTFGLNEKPKIWPVVELSRRLVIILAVVAFPGNQVCMRYCTQLIEITDDVFLFSSVSCLICGHGVFSVVRVHSTIQGQNS